MDAPLLFEPPHLDGGNRVSALAWRFNGTAAMTTMSRKWLQQRVGVSSSDAFAPTWVVAILLLCILVHTPEVFAKGEAVAEVAGETITADEIAKLVSTPLSKLEEQIYTLRKHRLDSLIATVC